LYLFRLSISYKPLATSLNLDFPKVKNSFSKAHLRIPPKEKSNSLTNKQAYGLWLAARLPARQALRHNDKQLLFFKPQADIC